MVEAASYLGFDQKVIKNLIFKSGCLSYSPLFLVLLEGGDVAGVGVGQTCERDEIAEQNINKNTVVTSTWQSHGDIRLRISLFDTT